MMHEITINITKLLIKSIIHTGNARRKQNKKLDWMENNVIAAFGDPYRYIVDHTVCTYAVWQLQMVALYIRHWWRFFFFFIPAWNILDHCFTLNLQFFRFINRFRAEKTCEMQCFVALSIKALDVESESFHAFHTAIGKLISELIFMYTLIKSTNWLLSCQSFHFDSCVTTFSWSRKTIFVAEWFSQNNFNFYALVLFSRMSTTFVVRKQTDDHSRERRASTRRELSRAVIAAWWMVNGSCVCAANEIDFFAIETRMVDVSNMRMTAAPMY